VLVVWRLAATPVLLGLFFSEEMKYRRGSAVLGCAAWLRFVRNWEVFMAEETAEQKLARLEAENKALREQIDKRKPGELRLKISEKGGLSVYGLGRFPVTLYKEQWTRLLNHAEEIKTFLEENDEKLKAKQ
jgi:ABC-type Fe3+-hydroxamate transport system substrate-binding protein